MGGPHLESTVFHPTVLNMAQAQIPLAVLRLIHKTLNQRGPEADAFLWDGSYDLPTLHLSVHITSLSCVPSEDLFESVLKDFNTLVSCTIPVGNILYHNQQILLLASSLISLHILAI